MASESEQCVDTLLARSRQIDELVSCFEKTKSDNEQLSIDARSLLENTQEYINNNRSVIPSYILMKLNASINKLEKHASYDKTKLTFKFKSPITSVKPSAENVYPSVKQESSKITVKKPDLTSSFNGFKGRNGERLTMEPSEVEGKDISLIDLAGGSVDIRGLASTAYIRNLDDVSVSIVLSCRAVTITNCRGCKFLLICQQLRIDSCFDCEFKIFTSARSMLESSKNLTFSQLNLDDITISDSTSVAELMKQAKFDVKTNNWRCIDDFDWLSPTTASENFKLLV